MDLGHVECLAHESCINAKRNTSAWTQHIRMSIAFVYRTVSFHNFESQEFKLSVSNPKSKYVAYLSVLSQISNC